MDEEVTRVGIYGGTFAPIHNGHIHSAKEFMEFMRLDYLFVIPTYIPPHKEACDGDNPIHRLNMCSLAFEGMDGVIVSDMEIARGGKSYTVDTLRELSKENRRLFLLMGTDMAMSLDTWKNPEEIFRLCYPIYIRRENDKLAENIMIEKNKEYLAKYGKVVRRVPCDTIELSSTQIREKIKMGEDVSDLVPEKVLNYIKAENLYK